MTAPRKKRRPRSAVTLPEAKNRNNSCYNSTATATETQGLRFAIHRLDRSRNHLRFSLMEGNEILDLLKRHPEPVAAAHISRQEQRIRRTQARLAEVQGSLTALHVALLLFEDVLGGSS